MSNKNFINKIDSLREIREVIQSAKDHRWRGRGHIMVHDQFAHSLCEHRRACHNWKSLLILFVYFCFQNLVLYLQGKIIKKKVPFEQLTTHPKDYSQDSTIMTWSISGGWSNISTRRDETDSWGSSSLKGEEDLLSKHDYASSTQKVIVVCQMKLSWKGFQSCQKKVSCKCQNLFSLSQCNIWFVEKP